MANKFLNLLVVVLAVSHILYSDAVPVTRSESLMHEHQVNGDNKVTADVVPVQEAGNGRMVIEINDYPGSGANNRHTPRRGCFDC